MRRSRRVKIPHLRRKAVLAVLLLFILLPAPSPFAGGPWRVMPDSQIMKWTASPILFHVDSGNLGKLIPSGALAQFQLAIDEWNAVGAVTLAVDPGGLPDINATDNPDTNANHYLNYWENPDAVTGDSVKVMFDAAGEILEDMFGVGAGNDILGLARLDTKTINGPSIHEASIIINGAIFDGVLPDVPSTTELRAVMLHEIGHALNLGHSALNDELARDGDAANDRYLPTMYPLLVDSESEIASLNPDDKAALIGIYSSGTHSIEGSVTFQSALYQGAQVVVRRVDPPPTAPPDAKLLEAYSYVSGTQYRLTAGFPPPPAILEGKWKIEGLASGNYQICVEQIDTGFTDDSGTQVGPLATPPVLPGPEECWDLSEGGLATDDPDNASDQIVTGAVTGIDILLNEAPGADPGDPAPGTNDTPATATALTPSNLPTTLGRLGPGSPDKDFFSVAVSPGDRLWVDVDADELEYGVDIVIGLWDGSGNPVTEDLQPVIVDDAVDPETAQLSLDPWLSRTVDFVSPAIIGVTCYPDTDFTSGCASGVGLPYWLRIEVDSDSDGDGTLDRVDVCPDDTFNDLDGDGACVSDNDFCPTQDGLGDGEPDNDGDLIADICDLCPSIYNPDQVNVDHDEFGDVCDTCIDNDGDGVGDPSTSIAGCPEIGFDNCPTFPNPPVSPSTTQADTDSDGQGDECDPCPSHPLDNCVDATPPQVAFALPTHLQGSVSTSSDLLLFFNDFLDSNSVDAATIFLEDDSTAEKVEGTVDLSDGSVVSFDPQTSLQQSTTYHLRMRPPLQDEAGNEVVEDLTTFTTLGRSDFVTTDDIGTDPPGTDASGSVVDDETGFSVALLGDVNNDNFDDYLYGSPSTDDVAPGAGKVTLVLGGTGAFTGVPTTIEFRGTDVNQHVGRFVADAGDFDGDGNDDFAFSAPEPATGLAKIWVVYGDSSWTALSGTTIKLLNDATFTTCGPVLDDGFCATVFTANPAEKAGISISRTADMSPVPDGIGELLIGAPTADVGAKVDAGMAYLVYGGAGHLGSVSGLAATADVVFNGEEAGDQAGSSVSLWSDPDTGLEDLIIGAPFANTTQRDGTSISDAGYVYAIFPTSALAATIELLWVGQADPPKVTGVVFLGTSPGGEVGRSVIGGIDVDGDGTVDVLYSANGEVYAIGGDGTKKVSKDEESSVREEIAGTGGGTTLRQIGAGNAFNDFRATRFVQEGPLPLRPMVVGGGGDLNGDGYDDFLIGDPQADSGAGRVYVVYGRPQWWPETVLMSQIGVTIPGLRIDAGEGENLISAAAVSPIASVGKSVASGRDVDGDCLDDALFGAPGGFGNIFVFSPAKTSVGPGTLDLDGDGVTACLDCDDTNPLAYPGNSEVCDGFDNNCNGMVDEGLGPDNDLDGVHACLDCNDFQASVFPGNPESCDGFDNDCNGVVDDTADLDGDGFYDCTDCDDTDFTRFPANPELCDGLDNDCDASTDESFTDLGSGCTVGTGVCESSGNFTCTLDGLDTECDATAGTGSTDICDTLDNDCDGSSDEDFPELGNVCVVGVGECQNSGNLICTLDGLGTECDATAGTGSTDICDTLDNDCDGATDEDGDLDGAGVCFDCNDLDGGSFDTPGEVLNLRFLTATDLAWDLPTNSGGSAIRYDMLRSEDPQDFVTVATCLETDDGTDTQAIDPLTPGLGVVFYYLSRAENDCPIGEGPLGSGSGGAPRTGKSCL